MTLPAWKVFEKFNRVRFAVVLAAVLGVMFLVWRFVHAATPAKYRFVAGERLVFRLEYTSASAADVGALGRGADGEEAEGSARSQEVFTSVETDIHATVLEANDEGTVLAWSLKKPSIQFVVNGDLALPQAEAIEADLSREIIVVLDAQGAVRSIHLDPSLKSLSHSFARALLAATQVVLADDGAATAWDAREEDPNGAYAADYEIEPITRGMSLIVKRRTEYFPAVRRPSLHRVDVERVIRPSGGLSIRFNTAEGRVESVDGAEVTSVLVEGKVVARTETTTKLTFVRRDVLEPEARAQIDRRAAALRRTRAITLATEAPASEREAIIQRSELGEDTIDTILPQLAKLEADKDASDTRAYLKVKALVYLHPEACGRLAQEMIAAKTDSRTFRLVMDAFSSVGNDAAQAALAKGIAARSGDMAALTFLVPALAMVETPTPLAEETLRGLATKATDPNLRAAAELGLGTMAHQLGMVEPDRANAIVRDMAVALAAAPSSEARRHYLLVLGNAGSEATFDLVAKYLAAAEPEVRSAAAAALRFLESARAEELLCKVLREDADADVRGDAAGALSFRRMTPTAFAAQKAAFLGDAATGVRLTCLQNLVRAAAAFPEARTILGQAAEDASEAIRDEAANLLDSVGKAGRP
ncbi:MAG: HEAT repeat domain-containing protein [Gemmataceae bacterium]